MRLLRIPANALLKAFLHRTQNYTAFKMKLLGITILEYEFAHQICSFDIQPFGTTNLECFRQGIHPL
jgi:hypothetical protein